MLKSGKTLPASIAAVVLSLAVAGCSAGAGEVEQSAGEPVRCEIDVSSSGGAIGLGATVHADRQVSGSYRFHVTGSGSGGSTNISQGGGFDAGPGDDARLGRLMLGNRGAIYDVRLDVNVGGRDYTCSERVGGA